MGSYPPLCKEGHKRKFPSLCQEGLWEMKFLSAISLTSNIELRQSQWLSKWDPGPVAAASPGNLLEVQKLNLMNLKLWEQEPRTCFHVTSESFWILLAKI